MATRLKKWPKPLYKDQAAEKAKPAPDKGEETSAADKPAPKKAKLFQRRSED